MCVLTGQRHYATPFSPIAHTIFCLPVLCAVFVSSLQVDSVAAADATNFRLHPSVEFWANYNTRFNSRSLSQVPEDTNAGRYAPLLALHKQFK